MVDTGVDTQVHAGNLNPYDSRLSIESLGIPETFQAIHILQSCQTLDVLVHVCLHFVMHPQGHGKV